MKHVALQRWAVLFLFKKSAWTFNLKSMSSLIESTYIWAFPHFDGSILRRRVDEVTSAPLDARDALQVAWHCQSARVLYRVPDLYSGILI